MRRISWLAPLVILVLGIFGSTMMGRDLDARAQHDLDAKLENDAAQLGMIFQGLASQFQAEIVGLATIAAVTDGDVVAHEDYIVGNQLFGPHGLVDMNGDVPELTNVVAPQLSSADAADTRDHLAQFVADDAVRQQLDGLGAEGGGFAFLVSSTGQRAIAAVATNDGRTYADVFPFDFGAAGVYLVNELDFLGDFVIYIGDRAEDGVPLIASTDALPLSGPTATTTLSVGGQSLLIAVTGRAAPDVSPAVATAVGIVATLLLAGAFAMALRRRDAAEAALAAARDAEQQRARMEADLQQAQRMESVGQLAGGIAHDFNNLLAAIASTAELVAEDVDDLQTRRDVEEILAATRRGAGLTRRLLTFSRRGVSAHQHLDINGVVEDLGGLLRRTIGENIGLTLDLAPTPVPVIGDPGEIEQILLNLVVNARDAADGPGHRIEVATRIVGDRALLSVRDNGTGMTPEVRRRALEPFFSTKNADEGTGLGLAIVYGIANRMGGGVQLVSTPGEYTTVTVELPLAPDAVAPADEAPEPAADPVVEREHGLVLLVEDEPAVRRAAARLIERAGYRVQTAGDGLEAIDIVRDGLRPSVLLTDVVLPGDLTGRDVAERIRAAVPGIRVVYASGYSRDVISADQLEREGAAFVAKPFTSSSLLAAIDEAAGAAAPA